MFSPFEELEYLADHLPSEGESILLSREEGELVCKPWHRGNLREGVHDPDLYGMLVQANERLNSVGSLPIWVTLLSLVWLTISLHAFLNFGWEWWFLVPGVIPLGLFGCVQWIRNRQQQLFLIEILPTLRFEIQRRGITPHALVSGVRQHVELRTILEELIRWSPAPEVHFARLRREDTLY